MHFVYIVLLIDFKYFIVLKRIKLIFTIYAIDFAEPILAIVFRKSNFAEQIVFKIAKTKSAKKIPFR